jgi:hypothetical protein
MNNVIQIKQKERGQSMVELALTITFLMALLAGTIDLGRAFFTLLHKKVHLMERSNPMMLLEYRSGYGITWNKLSAARKQIL